MADERRSFATKASDATPERIAPAPGDKDDPQFDWSDAGEGSADQVAYGADHADRPRKTEAERGQGAKTIERNRQIARGGLYR